ncbi:hypothetical protein DWW31_14015 [Clostridium sp. AF15-17LB]|nr:hypothetical protein DWW31_14015 [Clostridium sp. AF15-17LB]
MEGYRLWCKNKNEWEWDNSWIGINGCLMTLQHGCPYPLNCDTHILQRSTGRYDISGREVFEGDFIESHQGEKILDVLMLVKYGTYEAYCPADGCYMDNVGFYVEAVGYPQMPLGPLENYAKVIGNVFENPDWLSKETGI